MDMEIMQVNHYYPYGGLFGASTSGGRQLYKYGGKEFDRMHGLDWYDFMARMKDDWSFTAIDPLCKKYYSISPYAYCGNDPVNRVDPDGRDWYQDNSGSLIWKDSNEKTITSNDITYTNIGTDASYTIGNSTYSYVQNDLVSIFFSVLGNDQFQTQFDSQFGGEDRQRVACKRACDVMLSNVNVTSFGRNDATQQVGKEIGNTDDHSIAPTGNQAEDDKILVQDVELSGKPVIVGVDSGKHGRGYNDGTTDHWIVVSGVSYDLANGKTSYTYFDPGNRDRIRGTSTSNVLKKNSKGLWKNNRKYIVTNIRPNRK